MSEQPDPSSVLDAEQLTAKKQPPPIPDPWNDPVELINPIDPRLFEQDILWDHFARLRRDDPVHLNEMSWSGRYWSLTKFDDIMFVDKHHELFSSAHGITLRTSCPSKCSLRWTDRNTTCSAPP